jgi:hypothetical protein
MEPTRHTSDKFKHTRTEFKILCFVSACVMALRTCLSAAIRSLVLSVCLSICLSMWHAISLFLATGRNRSNMMSWGPHKNTKYLIEFLLSKQMDWNEEQGKHPRKESYAPPAHSPTARGDVTNMPQPHTPLHP